MDLILPLISNIALLALAAIVYSATPGINDAMAQLTRSAILGLGLGLISALVMLNPIQFAPGVIYDARSAPLLISGILGGPVAALIAVVPPVLLRVWIGGIGMAAGVGSMVLLTLCSVAAWAVMRRHRFSMVLPALLIFATVSSVIALPTLMLIPDKAIAWTLFSRFAPILVLTNVAGVAILGLMILHESRRRTLIADLRRSEAEAREALQVRNRFIALMSHEVRTPLNAILGYAQLLRDDTQDAGQKQRIDRLRVSAKSLLRMIDDILHFSRYQDRKEQVSADRRPLQAIVESALSSIRDEANRKGLDLRVAGDGVPDVVVELDADRLRRCLINTLSNAVQSTERGHVAIATTLETVERNTATGPDALLRIKVSDTGVGIDEQRLNMVFEPFERLDAGAWSGASLGMPIARAAVEAMGGSISIDSVPGIGTTVSLEIPTNTHDRAAAVEEGPHVDSTYVPVRQGLRVLVVDDVEVNAEIACAFLDQVGFHTSTAANGSEAVEAVRSGGFDAVLMDIEMPVMNGLKATREIRSAATDESARSVPIVALTAYASRDDMAACLDAGMNAYLTKPIDKASLFDALARINLVEVAAGSPPSTETSASSAVASNSEPSFSVERYASLAKLVPADTMKMVLQQAASEIESLGAQVVASDVESEDKRQALH